MNAAQALLARLFTVAEVVDTGWNGPRIREIRLRAAGLNWTPGQQVRIAVVPPWTTAAMRSGFRDVLRTYSVWEYGGEHLDLRVLIHGDGPGARWAASVGTGDEVHLRGPEGDFVLRDSGCGHSLFVGDETACVAFGPMIRASTGQSTVVAEVPEPDDQLPLAGAVTWTHRHDRAASSSQSLVETLRAVDVPAGTAYLAGEARTIQLVRAHLVNDRGWERRDIKTKPFWTPGKRGLE